MILPGYNWIDKLCRLWDMPNLLEGRRVQFCARMIHRIKLGIDKMCECLHEMMMGRDKDISRLLQIW